MYCPKCGAENHEDVKFCSQCGEQIALTSPVQDDAHGEEVAENLPQLWSPNLAAIWSLFLSPIFGAYIVSSNWEQLGEKGRASTASSWLWVGVAVYIIAMLAIPDAFIVITLIWLLLWYIFSARPQSKYVKTQYNGSYKLKSWFKPILGAIALWAVTLTAYGTFLYVQDPFGDSVSQSSAGSVASMEEYKASSVGLNYRSAQLGDYKHGTLLYMQGQISQIVDQRTAMVQTEHHEYIGYMGQPVLLRFNETPRLITGDEVIVFGRYAGTREYQTVLGHKASSPIVYVDHYSSK